jgi:hypothetical protein
LAPNIVKLADDIEAILLLEVPRRRVTWAAPPEETRQLPGEEEEEEEEGWWSRRAYGAGTRKRGITRSHTR